jgi:peptidoglycan/LPS O-acetylase OafA/YrhL
MSSETLDAGAISIHQGSDNAGRISKTRLLYIDNIRILLTILVILHHLAVGYGRFGIWYYNEPGQLSEVGAIAMLTFLAVNQAFFMGFFFMISSYFIPGSYDRKGAVKYSQDRLVRLGVPLVFYALVLAPILSYLIRPVAIQLDIGFLKELWSYGVNYIRSYPTIGIDVGPLWFVAALLVFTLAYVLWRVLTANISSIHASQIKTPKNVAILIFALVLGMISFTVRIQLPVGWEYRLLHWQFPHFTQYIAMFIVGIFAYRNQWFEGLTKSQGRFWTILAIALILFFPIFFIAADGTGTGFSSILGGLHWQSLLFSLWEQVLCVAIIVSVLVWFRERLNHQGAIAIAMAASAYATFIIHAPVIVLLAKSLRKIKMDLALKFFWVAPIAVILCFLVGFLVKKLPIARRIL